MKVIWAIPLLAGFASAVPTRTSKRTVGDVAKGQAKLDLHKRQSRHFRNKRQEAGVRHKRAFADSDPDHLAPVIAAAGEVQATRTTGVKLAAASASISLTDYYRGAGADVLYYGDVGFGTPAQSFRIDFDTGSADTWIPAPGLADATNYDPSKSSTFVNSSLTWEIQYGKGASAGYVVQDTVTLDSIAIEKQVFGLAVETDSTFQTQPIDGLMGVAFSTISEIQTYTPFETMLLDKLVNEPYFSIALRRGADEAASSNGLVFGGSICFGCMAGAASGTPVYAPVTLQAYWQVELGGIAVNGQSISNVSGLNAMLDSGTSYLYAPASVVDAIYKPLNGQPLGDGSGFYAVPADTPLSSFTITFAGTAFDVDIEDLVLGFVDDTKQTVALTIIASDDTDPTGAPLSIVGDLFMKNVVTVFNYNYDQNGNPAVGFLPVPTSTSSGASAVVGPAASSFGGSSIQTDGAQTPGIVTTTGTAGLSRSIHAGSTTAGGGFPTGGLSSTAAPSSTSKSSAGAKVEASAATVLLLSLLTFALAL